MAALLLEALDRAVARGPIDVLMLLVSLVAPVVALALPLLLARRGRPEGWMLLGVVIVGAIVAVELQWLGLRPRPPAAQALLPPPPTPGFPSGHATIAFALAVASGLLWRRSLLPALALAAVVALSRVVVGHHAPEDVVIGGVIGAGLGAVAYGRSPFAAPSPRPRWAWLLWGQLAVVIYATAGAYLGALDLWILRIGGMDKVLHLSLYGALALLLVGWCHRHEAHRVALPLAALATVEELLQALAPTRTFDLGDLACTLGGIALGATLARRLRERSPQAPPPRDPEGPRAALTAAL